MSYAEWKSKLNPQWSFSNIKAATVRAWMTFLRGSCVRSNPETSSAKPERVIILDCLFEKTINQEIIWLPYRGSCADGGYWTAYCHLIGEDRSTGTRYDLLNLRGSEDDAGEYSLKITNGDAITKLYLYASEMKKLYRVACPQAKQNQSELRRSELAEALHHMSCNNRSEVENPCK